MTKEEASVKATIVLIALATAWAGPASADETWKCPDGRYTISDDHPDRLDRNTPPLSYEIVQDDDVGIVAVAPDNSSGYVGMAGIVLRKSDGTLMRFGHALPAEPSKHPIAIGGTRIERCHLL